MLRYTGFLPRLLYLLLPLRAFVLVVAQLFFDFNGAPSRCRPR